MNITKAVKELHSKGLTNLEISQKTNFTLRQIRSVLQKNNLSSNRYKILIEDNQLQHGFKMMDVSVKEVIRFILIVFHKRKLSFAASFKE